MKNKILAFTITFVLIFGVYTRIFAATVNELQTKKNQTQQELTEVKTELSSEMKKISELNESIADNEEKISELNVNISSLEKEISEKQSKINEAQEKYNFEQEQLEKRLVANYKFGGASYIDVLLNSTDLTSFISNYYYISVIAKSDNDLLQEIENKKNEIENSKKELETKENEYSEAKKSIEVATNNLKNDKAKKDTYVAGLSSEQKDLQKQIDDYDNEIKKLEAQARQVSINSGKNNSTFVGGTMLWPCPSSRYITSYFGARNTGIPGASTNHRGIDIGASSGAAIVAVLDGTVVTSSYNSARGNYLMVDHGGGIITLYQHGKDETKRVSVGDKVTKGQTIMGVGHTGISGGDHLHFEVWKNGVPQNPLQSQYLGSY